MPALSLSSSRTSLGSSLSRNDYAPPSPSSVSSASSSNLSLDQQDEENITITAKRALVKNGKQKSQEDLRLLAVSTHMTELSYMISDIQTRIFEIQELRHKSQSNGDNSGTTSIIDQSLMTLDEKLEAVSKGMKTVNDALEPILQATPTIPQEGEGNERAVIIRKHTALVSEWEAVQDESDVLREELKEDKWLTVFRTVTDQADGMMTSLEKGVNRCQEFIWQVHRRGIEDTMGHSQREKAPPTFETFTTLLDSFEAKKKHYMPATSKVLSIIDKGVRDRVTKNGETLRRHAESAQRWKNLKERIARTDTEMETVRKILLQGDSAGSETGSSTSGTTSNGYLATPPSGSRSSKAGSSGSAISRSISPFRKFARKLTGNDRSPATPVTPLNVNKPSGSRAPSSEPTLRRQKTSIFRSPGGPTTPERPSHKYSQSLTPDSSPRHLNADSTIKGRPPLRPVWNSSTKVETEERNSTVKATPPRRTPSAAGNYADVPPMPPIGPGTPYRRSLSRTSMASSRPWSPLNSSVSTTHSSHPPLPTFRPPSRAQTPARAPSRAYTPGPITPRPRPNTPSHIPAPTNKLRSIAGPPSEVGDDDEPTTTMMQRAFSPTFSAASSGLSPPRPPSRSMIPRPPSRSMIPIPSVSLSTPSRPSTAMSTNYSRTESPSPSAFRSSAARAQTPESALKARAQQVPVYNGTIGRSAGRPPTTRLPPSSYRDNSSSRTPSRPGSRNGAFTPSTDNLPMHEYVPGNMNDPLDVEVASVVNSIAHGLLIERVDPPLKKVPKGNEEIKAQYAFSNALSRKVVTCKLTTLTRAGKGASAGGTITTKKVMCRVGGGWQDLSHYILNRQAGM